MRSWNKRPTNMAEADISYELERLFDPYNFDHIPEERRMDKFPQRDLSHVRHYKAAVKIFGGPLSRRRVIIASNMETPMRHRLGEYMDQKPPPKPYALSLEMTPKENLAAFSPLPLKSLIDAKAEAAKLEEHQKWINDRKKLRSDLNNMGISQAYLERKPNKSELERKLMNKLIEEGRPPPLKPVVKSESFLEPDPTKPIPQVKIPSPKALKVLDEFLQEKKMRLIDLFTCVDKNKNWTLSRDEFKKSMKHNKVPLTDEMIEDLILSLDTDCSDELDFREFSKGMTQFKDERRFNKRLELGELFDRSLSSNSFDEEESPGDSRTGSGKGSGKQRTSSRKSGAGEGQPSRVNTAEKGEDSQQDPSRCVTSPGKSGQHQGDETHSTTGPNDRVTSAARSAAGKSRTSSRASTSSQLTVPEFDLRPEQYVIGSEEAMVDHVKRTRSVLGKSPSGKKSSKELRCPSVILTGDKAIDDHSMFSQLEGDTGEMVNHFRQERLREYYAVCELCQDRGLNLTKELLDKVLLHPPDKPHSVIIQEIRKKPGHGTISSKFTKSSSKTKELQNVEKIKNRQKSVRGRKTDVRQTFPKQRKLDSRGSKMALSTGKVFIKPLTECWMSYEEYERLTSRMSRQYEQLHGRTNYNAFWPGYLLEKLRLCFPPYDGQHCAPDGSGAIFHNVKQGRRSNPGYNNDLNTFPMDCNGWVKYGDIDPYIRKPLVL